MATYPAYRIRLTTKDGRTFDTTAHGSKPKSIGALPVEILREGQSCVRGRTNLRFCDGCSRCDHGLLVTAA